MHRRGRDRDPLNLDGEARHWTRPGVGCPRAPVRHGLAFEPFGRIEVGGTSVGQNV